LNLVYKENRKPSIKKKVSNAENKQQDREKRLPTTFNNKSRNVKERKYIIRPINTRTKKVPLTKQFDEFSDDHSSDESSKNIKVQRRPAIFKKIIIGIIGLKDILVMI